MASVITKKNIGIGIAALVIIVGMYALSKYYAVLPGSIQTISSFDAVEGSLTPFNSFTKAVVTSVVSEQEQDVDEGIIQRTQMLMVVPRSGPDAGTTVEIMHQEISNTFGANKILPGDTVVMGLISNEVRQEYVIVDRYRLPGLIVVVAAFFALVLFFARWRGFASLAGLLFSLAVIIFFVAPNIALGKNPLVVAYISALLIVFVSTFLAHGFKRRTVVAVVSMVFTLGIAQGLAVVAVHGLRLFGTGSHDAMYLQSVLMGLVDLRGILLAGIIIGALGVLDDVATTQTATIEEIHKANPLLGFRELYRRGASVGTEHIAALVNTLVLAYTSVGLPVVLLLTLNSGQPFWVIINSEIMVEEIVRTLIGSTAIVLAVPIATLFAAYVFGKKSHAVVEADVKANARTEEIMAAVKD
jgi:uncharacterized membrane protein